MSPIDRTTSAWYSTWISRGRWSGIATRGGWAGLAGTPMLSTRPSHSPAHTGRTRSRSPGRSLPRRLSRTARGIKPALMDQKVLAGIGNIYADEVLHHARIHPERGADSLSARELGRLHRAIGEILTSRDRAGGIELRRGVSNGAGA